MKLSKLVNYAKVSIGQGAPQKREDFSNAGHPFIRAGSLELLISGGSIESLELISEQSAKRNRLKLYPTNSVVFAKSGMSATKNRVFKLTQPCYVVSHLAILLPNEKTDPEYLRLVVQYARPSTLIKDLAYPSIGQSDIENFKLPIPPLDDQFRIAVVLTRAEKLIAKRKESIKALDELLKSTFLEMFGDPVRNEKGWELSPLGNKISIKHGFAFHGEYFSNKGEYVLLTPGNFYEEGGYRYRGDNQKYYQGEIPQEYLLNKGDLLIAMTEQAPGLLGSSLIVPDSNKFLHNQRLGLIIFKTDDLNKLYLFHLFNHHNIRRLIYLKATGTKVRHTSPSKIEGIKVSLPPLELQNQFAAIVEKVEALKERYTQSLTELENIYGSLSQQAFKGNLDLSRVAVVYETEKKVGEIEITGSADVNSKTNLEFTLEDLVELIKKKSGKIFSFDEIWKEIEALTDKKIPSRDDIQEQIIKLLESDKENFQQVFDILTSEVGKHGVEKRIAFRGNYEN